MKRFGLDLLEAKGEEGSSLLGDVKAIHGRPRAITAKVELTREIR